VLAEQAAIDGTVDVAEPVFGSVAASLVTAALATVLVSAPAAFTISLVYARLAGAEAGG
jgi:hypothetical protein